MRVLFDQGAPVPLRKMLHGHSVSTAYELGWNCLGNGELIAKAESAGFDVLVTTDKNLKYQQNLAEPDRYPGSADHKLACPQGAL